ncbi:MAG: LLM class flavin-dependent oxidoreductase [Vulcanimicrobiota bacterium]
MDIPLSILDLAPITQGSDAGQALANTLDLAQHAEKWGYHRFWLAEHHNMPGIASAATSVVMTHVAGNTRTIRVGSGGIMLPNHSPLVIAEQFGTMASLFPGRIDLGLGRAPGTDPLTSRALRRDVHAAAERFPEDIEELQEYLGTSSGRIQAVPGQGTNVPIWLLGSSLFSARLAALKGLPYAFASHFAPGQMMDALNLYRVHFRPSDQLKAPRVMVAVNLYASDTEEEARLLFSSVQQLFVALRFGTPGKLAPPIVDYERQLHPMQRATLDAALHYTALGTPSQVRSKLQSIVEETRADELILVSHIFDHQKRLKSYEIGAEILKARVS